MFKKSNMEIQKCFRILQILYVQFLTKNVLILQNVLIPPNCILLAHSSRKCFNTSILYTTDTQFYNSSINIGSISFFFFFFFEYFAFLKFNMPNQKSDNSIRIIFLITSIIQVSVLLRFILGSVIKTYVKNSHFITNKCITKIFIEVCFTLYL